MATKLNNFVLAISVTTLQRKLGTTLDIESLQVFKKYVKRAIRAESRPERIPCTVVYLDSGRSLFEVITHNRAKNHLQDLCLNAMRRALSTAREDLQSADFSNDIA